MRPAWLTVLVTFHVRRKAFVGEFQLCHAFLFTEIKNQSGTGPFFFIRIPGHIAICNQPDKSFTGDELSYGNVKKRISAHLYDKLIILVFGVSRKAYAPPFRYIADLSDCLVCADLSRDTAGKIVLFHNFCFSAKLKRWYPEVLYKSELAGIVPGGELVRTVLQISWGEAGEPFKGPDEMGLIVVIMIKMVFQALYFDPG